MVQERERKLQSSSESLAEERSRLAATMNVPLHVSLKRLCQKIEAKGSLQYRHSVLPAKRKNSLRSVAERRNPLQRAFSFFEKYK